MKFSIWIPVFTRSEWGPLSPLISKAKEMPDMLVHVDDMSKIQEAHRLNHVKNQLEAWKPDLVLCGFDRPEMSLVAWQVYHKDVPIAQIFAGDIAGGAWDDADRFVISNYADLLFCADQPQLARLTKAMQWRKVLGTYPDIHLTGATHYDDMSFIEPEYKGEYKLIIYNPPSFADRRVVASELNLIQREIRGKVFMVASNGDLNSDLVTDFGKECTDYLGNLTRKEYLGYLKNASVVIGNSSSMFYEAPWFNVPIKQIGIRNLYRESISKGMCVPGASKDILLRMRYFLMNRLKTE